MVNIYARVLWRTHRAQVEENNKDENTTYNLVVNSTNITLRDAMSASVRNKQTNKINIATKETKNQARLVKNEMRK